jgi:hypothetical protein
MAGQTLATCTLDFVGPLQVPELASAESDKTFVCDVVYTQHQLCAHVVSQVGGRPSQSQCETLWGGHSRKVIA